MSIMSEEEKEAIDYLKNDVVYWLDKGKDFVVIDVGENEKLHTLLNLIDKQQKEIEEKTTILLAGAEKVKQLEKEIEELKERNKELVESIEEWINGERINDIKHISKDRIREKIKEYREETMRCQECKDYEDANINQRILLAFDELLEEK